jgi:sigma-E factor negative regulatory protein RseC
MNGIETGLVKKIVNDRVLVECEAVSMCNNCLEKDQCGITPSGKKREIWIDNVDGVAIGNRVSFRIEDGGIIYASLLLYLIPIIFLFAGIFIGYKLHSFFNIDIELSSIIFGMTGLIVSFIFIKIYSILFLDKERFKPIFIKKLD